MNEETNAAPQAVGPSPAMGPDTAKYLDDRAADSFKRQTDLEESIWRSLPLFTGGLLAAGAIITSTARVLPTPGWAFYPIVAYALLAVALAAFLVAFWWLWQVVRPRDFDYPADDEQIADYAQAMIVFHASQGTEGEALDKEISREMRLYMAGTFAAAAKSTFSNNQSRLSARGQVLIFLLVGFLLAFACDVIIFGHRLVFPVDRIEAPSDGITTERAKLVERGVYSQGQPAGSAADARDPGRRVADEKLHAAAGKVEVMADDKPTGSESAPASIEARRPSPPPMQRVTKVDHDLELAKDHQPDEVQLHRKKD